MAKKILLILNTTVTMSWGRRIGARSKERLEKGFLNVCYKVRNIRMGVDTAFLYPRTSLLTLGFRLRAQEREIYYQEPREKSYSSVQRRLNEP